MIANTNTQYFLSPYHQIEMLPVLRCPDQEPLRTKVAMALGLAKSYMSIRPLIFNLCLGDHTRTGPSTGSHWHLTLIRMNFKLQQYLRSLVETFDLMLEACLLLEDLFDEWQRGENCEVFFADLLKEEMSPDMRGLELLLKQIWALRDIKH